MQQSIVSNPKKPDWRKYRERAIARKHGNLASFHPLCRDCGVDLGKSVTEANHDTHCRKCENKISAGELISLVIFCEDCSKSTRDGAIRRLNYPAQCFDCGALLNGKLNSENNKESQNSNAGDWRNYLDEAQEILSDSEE